ncbi:carboxymuconolactone decarboxylase family protein [Streptomyces montanus]|uniref:Carboxymuconolactone decarboxylase family protein n=1 Tax=Streptomyces montanus TaxID=2580423 RepID=A0A5R9FU69_9ACTN|nr:carboxymuconolactone decarboxylase family protein [Streptomyces montanus]TLS47632.1 carboxymuconolactone decarboxylase family protein [Streptomyces montanus]
MTADMSDTTQDRDRVDVMAAAPAAYHAMVAFQQAAGGELDARLAELVRVRVSQINGCAFCVDLHTRAAREAGESEQRLHLLAAWRETALFRPAERAALSLAEAVTRLPAAGVPDAVYAEAAAWFDESDLAHLLWTIAAVNVWNRVAVSTRMGLLTQPV